MNTNYIYFKQCYSVSDLMTANGFDPELGISESQFSTLCPSLVQQIVSENCDEDDDDDDENKLTEAERKSFPFRYIHSD